MVKKIDGSTGPYSDKISDNKAFNYGGNASFNYNLFAQKSTKDKLPDYVLRYAPENATFNDLMDATYGMAYNDLGGEPKTIEELNKAAAKNGYKVDFSILDVNNTGKNKGIIDFGERAVLNQIADINSDGVIDGVISKTGMSNALKMLNPDQENAAYSKSIITKAYNKFGVQVLSNIGVPDKTDNIPSENKKMDKPAIKRFE